MRDVTRLVVSEETNRLVSDIGVPAGIFGEEVKDQAVLDITVRDIQFRVVVEDCIWGCGLQNLYGEFHPRYKTFRILSPSHLSLSFPQLAHH